MNQECGHTFAQTICIIYRVRAYLIMLMPFATVFDCICQYKQQIQLAYVQCNVRFRNIFVDKLVNTLSRNERTVDDLKCITQR